MKDLLVLLGKRIHDLRAAKHWSQEEFAHVSGFHRTYIGQIERGEKNMSFDNLAKVADSLGVTMAALLEGIEAPDATAQRATPSKSGALLKGAAQQQIAIERLVRRLKIQHAEMSKTIVALEAIPRPRRPSKSG